MIMIVTGEPVAGEIATDEPDPAGVLDVLVLPLLLELHPAAREAAMATPMAARAA
jgi:hypothetical protein